MVKETALLEIRLPRHNEYTLEAAQLLLTNLSWFQKHWLFWSRPETLALEIACWQQQIHFLAIIPTDRLDFFQSQLLAQYRDAVVVSEKDYLAAANLESWQLRELRLARSWYLPLKTADQFNDNDPLSTVLATMAKNAQPDDVISYQLVLSPRRRRWQRKLIALAESGGGKDDTGRVLPHPQKSQIELKASHPGFDVYLRLASNNETALEALAGSFGSFSAPQGNYLVSKKPHFWQRKSLWQSFKQRQPGGKRQLLNDLEIASLWHLPGTQINLPNIAWGRQIVSEPPDNLPIAADLDKESRQQITFIGKTEFKNKMTTFGIKRPDRGRHVYIIGKTGTGKSTLIANMAIEDIRKGEGVAVIDPHGDLIQTLLQYIPRHRLNDICYFNPADPDYDYPLNILEVGNKAQQELVASGIVSIFHKLYANSWGPRLEHILRNTLLTLTGVPGTTLADVPRILTEKGYRQQIVSQIKSPTLHNFWKNEFEPMGDRLRQEAISPILNKVGQFVSSPLIRKIVSYPQSRVKIEEIMNQGKIILVDLSQGKIGEDNSALLGAMIITQIQLAAMNRAYMEEGQRRPFYLYVDEFQDFATRSFIKILSEARKYKLNLTIANQYMAQLDLDVQNAILGNVGSLISFLVGAKDAQVLEKEFGREFSNEDLVDLGRYQILLKLSIDGETSSSFYATTLPLPDCHNQQSEKAIRLSRQHCGKFIANRQNKK